MADETEIEFEAQLEALRQIEDLKREKEELISNRAANFLSVVQVSRKEHEANKKQLKSDLKKTTAFVKKIRSINSEGLQQCIRDTETLNLTLYISEIVGAIVETAYKATDVPSMIKLCVHLHRRYDEFTTPLLSGLRTALFTAPAEDDQGAGKRKRIQIRFIVELFQVGICLDDEFFCQLLKSLMGKVMGASSKQPMDLLGLATFVKYGSETLLGFASRRMHQLARQAAKPVSSMPVKVLASQRALSEMKAEVSEAYQQLTKDLVKSHKDYKSRERKNEKDKMIHGSITEQKQGELDGAKRLFEKLFAAVGGLSDATGGDMPILEVESTALSVPSEDKDDDDAGKGSLSLWDAGSGAGGGDYGPYGDAESRAFYEDLPDLLSMVPLSALGLTPEQAATMREEWRVAKENAYTVGDAEADIEAAIDQQMQDLDLATKGDEGESGKEKTGITGSEKSEVNQEEEVDDSLSGQGQNEEKEKSTEEEKEDTPQARVLLLLQEKLPECTNKQRCDEFCTSFCYLNSKGARKKLAIALIKLPRSRLDLTSTYSRVIASLSRVMPKADIVEPVMEALKREFFGMMKTKNQQYVDNKIRNIRYLAELVKFGIAPPITAFRMFKTMMADFTPHNIELTANLLETCGRYLYLLPYTHDRTCEIVETMLRLRRAKNLDLRLQTLLEAAYFAVKPPERVARKTKILTNVQKYVRFLIFEKLDAPNANVDLIIKSLRRLPWLDPVENVEPLILKCALRVARTKYVSIPTLADCLSGLFKYRPNLLVKLVDRILEEVQRGLDAPHKREPQRILGLVRLLGELYNYSVVSAPVIYELLYTVINYGHRIEPVKLTGGISGAEATVAVAGIFLVAEAPQRYDPRFFSDLDLPGDLFRAQLVCEALNTCGAYYVRGQAKERLARYLVYFQRYLLTKPLLPTHIEFAILDTFDNLEELARAAAITTAVKAKSGTVIKGKSLAATTASIKAAATAEVMSAGPMFIRYDSLEQVQIAVEALEIKPEEAMQDVVEEEDDDDEAEIEEVLEGEGVEEEGDEGDLDAEEREREEALLRRRAEEEEEEQSEREAARMLERMRASEEDEEFERAFRSMVHESVQGVKTVGTYKVGGTDRMAIPALLPKPKNIAVSRFRSGSADDDDMISGEINETSPRGTKAVVAFKLLSRDQRGRVETRQLLVPEEAPMAVKLARAEAAQRLERQRLKERVLQIDSLTEMGDDRPAPIERVYNRPLDSEGDRQGYGGRGPGGSGAPGGGRSGGRGILSSGRGMSGVGAGEGTGVATGTGNTEDGGGRGGGGGGGASIRGGRGGGQGGRGYGGYARGSNEERKPVDTLNLDQFLAETNRQDMRASFTGRPQMGGPTGGQIQSHTTGRETGSTSGVIAPSGLYVPGSSSNSNNWRERK